MILMMCNLLINGSNYIITPNIINNYSSISDNNIVNPNNNTISSINTTINNIYINPKSTTNSEITNNSSNNETNINTNDSGINITNNDNSVNITINTKNSVTSGYNTITSV